MKVFSAGQRKWLVLAALVLLGCLIFFKRDVLRIAPFPISYTVKSPSDVFTGKQEQLYIISDGKKEIDLIGANRKLKGMILGGSEDASFYYASQICDDEAGNLYVADVVYAGQGTRISRERILSFDAAGGSRKLLYEVIYKNEEEMPYQYGNILSLCEEQGKLYLLRKTGSTLLLETIELTSGEVTQQSIPIAYDFSDACYEPEQQLAAFTTRQGYVYAYNMQNDSLAEIAGGSAQTLPWKVWVGNGSIYYTDLYQNAVNRVDYAVSDGTITTTSRPAAVLTADSVLYSVDCSQDGTIYSTDYDAVYVQAGEDAEIYHEFGKEKEAFRIGIDLLVLLLLLYLLVWVLRRVAPKLRDAMQNQTIQRAILVILPVIVVVSITSALTIRYFVEAQTESNRQEITLFARMIQKEMDLEKLNAIQQLGDYRQADFLALKEQMDSVIDEGYTNGQYCYYTLYRLDGEEINAVMDYEATLTINYPAYSLGDAGYTEAFQEGKTVVVDSDVSAYGSWSFVLMPIFNEKQEVAAVLEVGKNLDALNQSTWNLIWQTVLTAVTTSIVFLMLFMEAIFFFSYRDKKKVHQNQISFYMPLRTLMFTSYVADSMQDCFIAITAAKLYQPMFGIPAEMGAAVPISLELLMAALFSFIGGKLVMKIGTKQNMFLGFAAQCAGFLICGIFGTYLALLIGKVLIGVGMGIVYVTCNTLAVMESEEELSEAAFADISAGILSGVSIGAGLGTVILSFSNYRILFLFGALILLLGAMLGLRGRDCRPMTTEKKEQLNITQFFMNPKVFTFFLFLLLPFMMALSFREYFFPLYVEGYQIDEVAIGRIYLACGLVTLYIGPWLSKLVLSHWGRKKAVVMASVFMCLMMGMFVLMPSVYTAIAGVVILSVIVSFAYTCQYSYFGALEECASFGEGNAMGVYSVIENVGQTVGPIFYGTALLLGNRNGIALVCILMTVLVGLFLLTNIRKNTES